MASSCKEKPKSPFSKIKKGIEETIGKISSDEFGRDEWALTQTATNRIMEGIRKAKASRSELIRIKSPKQVFAHFFYLTEKIVEYAIAIALSEKGEVLHYEEISRGTVDFSAVSPAEVFGVALAHGASYVIVLHNHPSGDPSPSPDDLKIKERIVRTGAILEIQLADFMVIGKRGYFTTITNDEYPWKRKPSKRRSK